MKKRGFVICTVRGATEEYKKELETFVTQKEDDGWEIHLPHRDTKQDARGIDICIENFDAIFSSDKVFVFYNPDSQGTHFDMGVAFAISQLIRNGDVFGENIPIEIIKNIEFSEGKSYARMLTEWQKE